MRQKKILSRLLGASFFLCCFSATAQQEEIRLATWNIAWLANDILSDAQFTQCQTEAKTYKDMDKRPTEDCRKGAPFRRLGDYILLADHAKRINADIVALQEVQGEDSVRRLFDGFLPQEQGAQNFIKQGTYEIGVYGKGGWQRTAIAVKKSILAPNKHIKFTDFDAIGIPLQRDKRGALEAEIPLKNGRTLHVLSIHLKSRCTTDSLSSGGKHCPELAEQAPILAQWIKEKNDTKQQFIIMGDFNRVLSAPVESCDHANSVCRKQALAPWLDENALESLPTIAPTATLHHPIGCFDEAFSDLAIEHILFGGGSEANYMENSVKSLQYIDPKTGAPISDHNIQSSNFSDHCVVEALWRLE